MVQKFWIYLLRLLRYDFFKIFNFDFRFGQEVKVKLGSLFYQYFLTNNDLYNGCKNFEFTSCGCWDMIFLNSKLWLPVYTGSKGLIGVTFLKIFFWELTICTILQHKLWIYLLRLLRYDFLKIFNFDFRFGQEVKGQIGVTFFVNTFLRINDLYNGAKIGNVPLVVVEIWLF